MTDEFEFDLLLEELKQNAKTIGILKNDQCKAEQTFIDQATHQKWIGQGGILYPYYENFAKFAFVQSLKTKLTVNEFIFNVYMSLKTFFKEDIKQIEDFAIQNKYFDSDGTPSISGVLIGLAAEVEQNTRLGQTERPVYKKNQSLFEVLDNKLINKIERLQW